MQKYPQPILVCHFFTYKPVLMKHNILNDHWKLWINWPTKICLKFIINNLIHFWDITNFPSSLPDCLKRALVIYHTFLSIDLLNKNAGAIIKNINIWNIEKKVSFKVNVFAQCKKCLQLWTYFNINKKIVWVV